MDKLPLSLVVIALNEEKNIQRCLQSVPFAMDILVVDSMSSDKTVEIAQKMGARVVQEKWRGYGAQKALASDLAKFDWILSLDADEALSEELQNEIKEKFLKLKPDFGYKIPRKSFHLGRWILHGGWYPDYQLRLYNKKYSKWPDANIHERVISPQEEKLDHPILHWVFEGVSDQVLTNDKYSTLQAQELFKNKNSFSVLKLLIKPVTKFIELYFFKQGFKDGLAGFIIAISASYSVFIRFAKLWELEKLNPSHKEVDK